MAFLFGLQDTLLDFFEKGGGVVVFIGFLIVLMWSFILERFWYFKYIHSDVEKDIQGVVIDYENQNSKEIERQGEDNSIFDKKFVDKFLKQDCTETQLWLNIDNSTWHDWLRLRETGLVESQMHPSEEGIKLWYDNFLQKYLT